MCIRDRDTLEEKPDVIVVDPPRAGINYKALPKILKYGVDQILYISCNPKTLVENLRFMEEHGYAAGDIKAYDNFPFTEHIESVVLMSRVETVSYTHLDVYKRQYQGCAEKAVSAVADRRC